MSLRMNFEVPKQKTTFCTEGVILIHLRSWLPLPIKSADLGSRAERKAVAVRAGIAVAGAVGDGGNGRQVAKRA